MRLLPRDQSHSPSRFTRRTFEAWRVLSAGNSQVEYIPEGTIGAEAIAQALACEGSFGSTLLIRETDSVAGTAKLHAFKVRRGSWRGRYAEGLNRKIYPYNADPLFSVEVKAFDPVTPWRWTPGCDAVGRDPNIIEGAAA